MPWDGIYNEFKEKRYELFYDQLQIVDKWDVIIANASFAGRPLVLLTFEKSEQ